ncbi:MAG: polymerase sigma-70 factor, subfamily [Microbacteriaceae bacterium]|nr:polymerase sigma-70 factor, subfamily [Microbacteriaceae bacterium]
MITFAEAFAEEWPRVVGATLRSFRDLDLAEDSAQEAFARAAGLIARGERIDNLGSWATTAARRIAIDSLRRDAVLRAKLPMLVEPEGEQADPADDRLTLIFVACDRILSTEQQVVLALRIVCGVPVADIADFFGVREATIAARLTRAKKALARGGDGFAWPDGPERDRRLESVLTAVYGVYTLGHTAPAGDELMDARLAALALSLARSVAAEYPRESEVLGLLAIIELGEGRRPARTTAEGMALTLAEVDRSAWGRQRIRAGLDLAARALPGGGRFALQAGIAGLHSSAPSWEQTDWGAISTLYHGLLRVWPAPVVRLGAIIARSHAGELARSAAELHAMAGEATGEFARRVQSAIGDVAERQGDPTAAVAAYRLAVVGENNQALVRYFERTIARLET